MSVTFQKISEGISKIILDSNKTVLENAAIELAKPEITRRQNLILKAYTRLEKVREELTKIKPDVTNFSTTGEKNESYSAGAWNKKATLESEINKLEKGMEDAMSLQKPDYSLLTSLIKDDKKTE
jgi:hypothetical protein